MNSCAKRADPSSRHTLSARAPLPVAPARARCSCAPAPSWEVTGSDPARGIPNHPGWGPSSGDSGEQRAIRSLLAKNPRHIPAVVVGVASIRGDDIGEFHGPSF